jgi:hypothetical protein
MAELAVKAGGKLVPAISLGLAKECVPHPDCRDKAGNDKGGLQVFGLEVLHRHG